jgi:hypothetical protein
MLLRGKTDVARESADIVLFGNDLARFADTVAIVRCTRPSWVNAISGVTAHGRCQRGVLRCLPQRRIADLRQRELCRRARK